MSFLRATSVSPDKSVDGRYHGEVHDGWDIGGNANGGYLISIAARAMAAASGRAHPVTLTAHYLSPGRPGPVTIDTEIVKSGKSFVTVTGSMRAEGKPVLQLLGAFSDIKPTGDVLLANGAPPDLPPVEECIARSDAADHPDLPPFHNKVELRLHPEDSVSAEGVRSGKALVRGWFRLIDDEPLDAFALLQASDAFPPTIFNANLPVAWVPTLELTVQVRSDPAPGWLRGVFTTRFVTDGLLEEDAELWDSTGRLVALSRQLALVPRVPS
ncbi:MAG: thioesterase family protein [Acidimicrobiales bacterium]